MTPTDPTELQQAVTRVRLCRSQGPDVAYPDAQPGAYIRDCDEIVDAFLSLLDAGDATAEAKLREAIRDAGFGVMETSGKWSIHCVTDAAKRAEEVEGRLVAENIDLAAQVATLRAACSFVRGHECEKTPKQNWCGECYRVVRAALAATAPTPRDLTPASASPAS